MAGYFYPLLIDKKLFRIVLVYIENLFGVTLREFQHFSHVQKLLPPCQLFAGFHLFDKGIEFLFGEWHPAKI